MTWYDDIKASSSAWDSVGSLQYYASFGSRFSPAEQMAIDARVAYLMSPDVLAATHRYEAIAGTPNDPGLTLHQIVNAPGLAPAYVAARLGNQAGVAPSSSPAAKSSFPLLLAAGALALLLGGRRR